MFSYFSISVLQMTGALLGLCHLYQSGLAATTTDNKLAAVSFVAKAEICQDPFNGFRLNRAIQGWAWGSPLPKDARRPVAPLILSQLLANNLLIDI